MIQGHTNTLLVRKHQTKRTPFQKPMGDIMSLGRLRAGKIVWTIGFNAPLYVIYL